MKEYKVNSSTSSNVYIVRYFEESDKWTCECPSYIFHDEGFECKHIKTLKENSK